MYLEDNGTGAKARTPQTASGPQDPSKLWIPRPGDDSLRGRQAPRLRPQCPDQQQATQYLTARPDSLRPYPHRGRGPPKTVSVYHAIKIGR